ncbi:hypothetical protein Ciccas_002351 [Cichlidogyrus casuarinus]|uniref:Uncharacterized protein n=1 Tax=Cichlidogyrus casuarinus TaxID=1844966 RepID=A0ABD2QHU6_9PLAT
MTDTETQPQTEEPQQTTAVAAPEEKKPSKISKVFKNLSAKFHKKPKSDCQKDKKEEATNGDVAATTATEEKKEEEAAQEEPKAEEQSAEPAE